MPFVTIHNQKIYYAEQGKHGTPIIFVHGSGANHLVWGTQMRALGDMAQCVSLDLPGHGKSDLPGCNSVQAYSDVILGLMDALHFERAVIVGHSLGGAIAQMIALSHHERVAGLGLIGTGAKLRVNPIVLNGILNDFENTVRFIIENTYVQPMNESLRKLAEDQLRLCPGPVTHDDFIACNTFDVMARLSEITAPTLVICGKQDLMAPPKFSEYLATSISGSRLLLIDHAGHSVTIEQAETVNQALIDFMRRF